MAILKAGKSGQSLSRAIKYAAKDAKDNPTLFTGSNYSRNPEDAARGMMDTKRFWHKTDGRQYKSYIQSFAPGEVTPQLANEIGAEWARKTFGAVGFEYCVGTHVTSKSGVIHNHIIVNSVNFETGKKIQTSKKDLDKLKIMNDKICKEYGLSVIDRGKNAVEKRGRLQAWDNNKYRSLHNKDSWMIDAAKAMQAAMHYPPKTSKIFVERMARQGWQVQFRGQKHITLTNTKNPREKVRADTLAKTFMESGWTRAAIEKGFAPQTRQAKKPLESKAKDTPVIRQPKTAAKTRPPSDLTRRLNSGVGRLLATAREDEIKKRFEWEGMSKLDREVEMERE